MKKLTRPMQTFKSVNSAAATLAGIEVAHVIRKGQFDQSEQSGFAQFAALAGYVWPLEKLSSPRRNLCDTTPSFSTQHWWRRALRSCCPREACPNGTLS